MSMPRPHYVIVEAAQEQAPRNQEDVYEELRRSYGKAVVEVAKLAETVEAVRRAAARRRVCFGRATGRGGFGRGCRRVQASGRCAKASGGGQGKPRARARALTARLPPPAAVGARRFAAGRVWIAYVAATIVWVSSMVGGVVVDMVKPFTAFFVAAFGVSATAVGRGRGLVYECTAACFASCAAARGRWRARLRRCGGPAKRRGAGTSL